MALVIMVIRQDTQRHVRKLNLPVVDENNFDKIGNGKLWIGRPQIALMRKFQIIISAQYLNGLSHKQYVLCNRKLNHRLDNTMKVIFKKTVWEPCVKIPKGLLPIWAFIISMSPFGFLSWQRWSISLGDQTLLSICFCPL